MINILVHGLGQNEKSWDQVKANLDNQIKVECPNLFELVKNYEINYENMYQAFLDYCNSFNEKVNLCRLSLGGLLAIDYAVDYPDKVNSLILIGTPYEVPKKLLKIQNFIFKIMPKKTFENMGISKNNFINLTKSMTDIEIKSKLKGIKCNTLILCGKKDNANIESAKQLKKHIKKSELIIIENSAHEVNVENPIELSNIIKKKINN